MDNAKEKWESELEANTQHVEAFLRSCAVDATYLSIPQIRDGMAEAEDYPSLSRERICEALVIVGLINRKLALQWDRNCWKYHYADSN